MIEVKNICAGYDRGDVLHDVSFSVSDGEHLSIIGPNGCGKTTLLRVIANVIPFKGEVLIDGVSIRDMNRRELANKVALLSQMTNIFFNYTVKDTVLMGRYAKQSKSFLSGYSANDYEIVDNILEKLGLKELANKTIMTLSGGQLQRVMLAKILAQQPDIILLDEPTNHLDLYFQIELIDFIKEWARESDKTVIGVLHDISLATRLSKNTLLMKNGKKIAFGAIRKEISDDILKDVYNIDVASYMKSSLSLWED